MFSFSAQSNNISTECETFQNGFYGGIRAGLSKLHSNFELHSQMIDDDELSDIDLNGLSDVDLKELSDTLYSPQKVVYHSKIKRTRCSIGLHLGYLYRLPYENCPLVFSPEIFSTYHPLSVHTKLADEPFRYTTKTAYSFGGNFRIGILVVHNLLLYGFTGIACTSFKFKVHDNTEHRQCAKKTKYKPAFTYGVGIEHELANTHRIRLELGISLYNRIKFYTTSHDDFISHSLKIKPRIYIASIMYSVPF